MPKSLSQLLAQPGPILALAPMQDVTDRAFWSVLMPFGGADVFVTEYFRVYPQSCLNREILSSITRNPTGRPVIAQMIGNEPSELVRTARELEHYPVAAIDLNLGCPAPVVYRKCAGGGLLREPNRVDLLLGTLRDAIRIPFTVKMRVGFESTDEFDRLLPILARHSIDWLVVHGRTVREMYRSEVHYDLIRRAAEALPYPVLANGNIASADRAWQILAETKTRGLMIGRGAIRNPWLFEQIRAVGRGETPHTPLGREVLHYVQTLYQTVCPAEMREQARVQKIKKHLNYLGLGVDPVGAFLHAMRRVQTEVGLFQVCRQFLDHDQPMPLVPFALSLKESDVLAGSHT